MLLGGGYGPVKGLEVWIKVEGTRTEAETGEQETIVFETRGRLYRRGEAHYLIYQESELAGMEGTTTTLKLEPGRVTLNRMGSVSQKQVFEGGKVHRGEYVTPFGRLPCEVRTSRVEVSLTATGARINLEYELLLAHQSFGFQALCITVREAG
ncbi:DUF1934 domain-containing protein [Desulfothermobacter acidiphilus]|uniref:DUF1934 domain-containing protein n=1 Tax=Desulfothermobacter acidiphilus TaxID=1938353 RepID=UPI003F8AB6D4